MADIKTKGSLEKSKMKTPGFIPKEAKSIIQEKYQEQQERNAPGKKDPVRYATDHVESGGKRVARTAGDAIKQKAKNEFVKKRHQKRAQSRDTGSEQSQPQTHPAEQAPFTEPASPASDKLSRFVGQDVPPVTQDSSTSETSFDMYTGDTHTQGERVSPSHYYGQNPSTKSAYFPTTNSTNSSAETQCSGKQQKTQARHSSQSRQQKFNTGAQSHRIEAGQQPPSHGDIHSAVHIDRENTSAIRKPLQSYSQTFQGWRGGAAPNVPAAEKSSSKMLGKNPNSRTTRPIKADGNRPKMGSVVQRKKPSVYCSRSLPKQISPAQRAKSFVQKKSQAKMAKQTAQRTRQATVQTGKRTIQFVQAMGRAAAAAVQGALAAGGGIALLVLFLCLILVAAIAASPFGIFLTEGGSKSGVPVSVAVAQVNYAYHEVLEELQSGSGYNDIVLEGTGADWADVLAVFAVKVAGNHDMGAMDIVTLDENRIDKLEAVFWDMTAITHEVKEINHPESSVGAGDGYTERVLYLTISAKTAEEMAAEYGFTEQQLELLQELLDEREMLESLIGSLMQVTADAKNVPLNLPADLSPEREKVIRAACSLVGKVNYFWGGKSLVLGWDNRWGRLTEVTAAGSSTTGTYRPYGLDCSGFVDWVFYNATGGEYIIGHGGGAMAQHGYCTSITWAEAQIGDLVFYPEDSHVGIVCGWDESGNILIVHCAFSANNVVITGQEGFTTIGRPVFYGGA